MSGSTTWIRDKDGKKVAAEKDDRGRLIAPKTKPKRKPRQE